MIMRKTDEPRVGGNATGWGGIMYYRVRLITKIL